MRKLTTGEKICVGVVTVATIATTAIFVWSKQTRARQDSQLEDDRTRDNYISTAFNEYGNTYLEQNYSVNLNSGSNTVYYGNNTVNNTVDTNNTVTTNSTTNNVVGQEEQESIKTTTSGTEEERAIAIAKEKWGISVDSYDYEAVKQSSGIYSVTVINKNTRYSIVTYTVDVNKGTAVQQ